MRSDDEKPTEEASPKTQTPSFCVETIDGATRWRCLECSKVYATRMGWDLHFKVCTAWKILTNWNVLRNWLDSPVNRIFSHPLLFTIVIRFGGESAMCEDANEAAFNEFYAIECWAFDWQIICFDIFQNGLCVRFMGLIIVDFLWRWFSRSNRKRGRKSNWRLP